MENFHHYFRQFVPKLPVYFDGMFRFMSGSEKIQLSPEGEEFFM